MSLHAAAWQIIGTSVTAIIGVSASLYIATKNRSQLIQRGKDTLTVQRVANARSAATFIADKRQKWIDDLREDVSLYVALTGEMTEGWKRTFARLGVDWDNAPPQTQNELEQFTADTMLFAASIAERDSQHYQILTRILLRLNTEEVAHNGLVNGLFKIRSLLADLNMNATRHEYANQEIYLGIVRELQFAQVYAKVILKDEWQKLKREMADPERLIDDILATSAPDDAAVKDFVHKTAPSVPSPLSEISPTNMNRSFLDDGHVAGEPV